MSQYKKGWVKNDDTFNKVGKLTFSSKNQAICDMQKNDINALILWTVWGTFSAKFVFFRNLVPLRSPHNMKFKGANLVQQLFGVFLLL